MNTHRDCSREDQAAVPAWVYWAAGSALSALYLALSLGLAAACSAWL
jgi:hypothetical protein